MPFIYSWMVNRRRDSNLRQLPNSRPYLLGVSPYAEASMRLLPLTA